MTDYFNDENSFSLFNDQPDEIISLYIKHAKCVPQLRLVSSRLVNIYDDLAPQKCKLLKLTKNVPNPPYLPYKWLYKIENFMPSPEMLSVTYSLKIENMNMQNDTFKSFAYSLGETQV